MRKSPFGSTSVTMAEMVPVNVSSRLVAPFPPNLFFALASMPNPRLASPPNLIHPLDAAHCGLVAIECQLGGAAGRRQAFDHNFDGFGTHFEDGTLLDQRTRKTFHRMYFERSRPILDDMHDQWTRLLPGADGPPPPAKGTYDPRGLFANPYFFAC